MGDMSVYRNQQAKVFRKNTMIQRPISRLMLKMIIYAIADGSVEHGEVCDWKYNAIDALVMEVIQKVYLKYLTPGMESIRRDVL